MREYIASHYKDSCGSCTEEIWLLTIRNETFCVFFLSALLIKAHSMPFEVQPSTMASVVKGLYSLRPGEPCVFCLDVLISRVSLLFLPSPQQNKKCNSLPAFRISITKHLLTPRLFPSFRVGPVSSCSLLRIYSTNQPSCCGVSAVRLRRSWPEAADGALHERISTVSLARLQSHSSMHSLFLNITRHWGLHFTLNDWWTLSLSLSPCFPEATSLASGPAMTPDRRSRRQNRYCASYIFITRWLTALGTMLTMCQFHLSRLKVT